jgi:hypothetical protein
MFFSGCDPSVLGSSDYGSAQINGYVIDAFSKNAIKDVMIMTYPVSDSVETGESGNFFIYKFYLNTNPQEILIIAEKPGYQTAQVKMIVHTNETANITIPLIRK